MELTQQKYKETEAGLIPEDWTLEKIEDFASITTGGSDTQDRVKDGEYPFYVRSNTIERINKYSFDGEAILTSGDGVGVGKIFHYVTGKFDYHQRVYNIFNYRKNVDGKYLFFQFSTNFYNKVMSMTAKSSVDSVRREMIADMKIPLPTTIKEQKAIATALSDVDELISNLDQLITKKKAIKQGAMQQLLTPPHKGGKRLAGFTGEWVEKTLGELGECIIGLTYKPTDVSNSGTLVLRSSNIQNDQLSFKDNVYVNVDIPIKLRTQIDDILVCVRNGSRNLIGKCARIDSRCVNESFGAFMSIYRSPYNRFISHLFKSYSIQKQIEENLGATINQITNKTLNSFIIWFPKDEIERNTISNVIDDITTEINELETKKAKYQNIKQGMMQELLTGKTRLI